MIETSCHFQIVTVLYRSVNLIFIDFTFYE